MSNKRKNNTLLSYFNNSIKSTVDSDLNDLQPAPSQQKQTDTVNLVSKKIVCLTI
jgi:hypothetical protein